uniref:NADH-plastoquinone oxidoreductase subunit 3 n=1 Tax=Selaginella tamariscina TaxID=137178 RepID=A0A482CIQ2_9TRAC|nr:NADH-plastoquinone oxidoreductase subunit 3 [Selaginella tamariscina]QBL76433.1 NADH-plastoquinone oxidoreductase subunit 3 [Selaginella tamariscina]
MLEHDPFLPSPLLVNPILLVDHSAAPLHPPARGQSFSVVTNRVWNLWAPRPSSRFPSYYMLAPVPFVSDAKTVSRLSCASFHKSSISAFIEVCTSATTIASWDLARRGALEWSV